MSVEFVSRVGGPCDECGRLPVGVDAIVEVLEEKFSYHAISTSGSYGFELDQDLRRELFVEIAKRISNMTAPQGRQG